MNSGPTAERVYDAIKRRIMERGFHPGERIDPAHLSDELASSVTPVRDALHRLVGEYLVEARTSEGFHLPHIDGPGLEDLYDWNVQLLTVALNGRSPLSKRVVPDPASPDLTHPETAVADLFARIAARTGNAEHAREIASLNDRLHAVRLGEARLLSDCEEEYSNLLAAFEADELPRMRTQIRAYHRRRRATVAEIIRALYRGG